MPVDPSGVPKGRGDRPGQGSWILQPHQGSLGAQPPGLHLWTRREMRGGAGSRDGNGVRQSAAREPQASLGV